jgi:hypothetical protein
MSATRSIWVGLLASVAVATISGLPASAQQITGTPGSPSATTTIPGNQLPPPPQKFEGKIERNAAQSTPYWPARVVPPKRAPNVDRNLIRGGHYGQRSCEPRKQAEHMAAPTNAAK